ncbi:hypothetical protein GJ496_004442 [Pomphorhynchus laevis]|nr:hypothetical protein GJ496_005387 [Pomphorhynchus laevis]KAI0981299.1 hypothetical protein GJ496_004442 [Pomphorhynchus laevis]
MTTKIEPENAESSVDLISTILKHCNNSKSAEMFNNIKMQMQDVHKKRSPNGKIKDSVKADSLAWNHDYSSLYQNSKLLMQNSNNGNDPNYLTNEVRNPGFIHGDYGFKNDQNDSFNMIKSLTNILYEIFSIVNIGNTSDNKEIIIQNTIDELIANVTRLGDDKVKEFYEEAAFVFDKISDVIIHTLLEFFPDFNIDSAISYDGIKSVISNSSWAWFMAIIYYIVNGLLIDW